MKQPTLIVCLLCYAVPLLSGCQDVTVTPLAADLPTESAIPDPLLTEDVDGFPWWNSAVFYEVFVRSFIKP